MEPHVTNESLVITGRTKKPTQPRRTNLRCKKLSFASITYDKCNRQFWVWRRFPSDHACKTTQTQSKPAITTANVNTETQDLTCGGPVKSGAITAAIKRLMTSTGKSVVKPNPSSSSITEPPQPNQKPSYSLTLFSSTANPQPPPETSR